MQFAAVVLLNLDFLSQFYAKHSFLLSMISLQERMTLGREIWIALCHVLKITTCSANSKFPRIFSLMTPGRPHRRQNANDDVTRTRQRNVLSQKRLQIMRDKAKNLLNDNLESSEQSNTSNLDTRTERQKGALLLWVCPLLRILLNKLNRQMNILRVKKRLMQK